LAATHFYFLNSGTEAEAPMTGPSGDPHSQILLDILILRPHLQQKFLILSTRLLYMLCSMIEKKGSGKGGKKKDS